MNDKTINKGRENHSKKTNPNDSTLRIVQGEFNNLSAEELEELKNFETDFALELYIRAECYYQIDIYSKAQQMLELYLKLYFLNSFAWNRLGTIYILQDEQLKAVNCFEKALELLPDDEEYLFNYTSTLHDLGLLDKASAALKKYFHEYPETKKKLYIYWHLSEYPMRFIKTAWRECNKPSLNVLNGEPISNGNPNESCND